MSNDLMNVSVAPAADLLSMVSEGGQINTIDRTTDEGKKASYNALSAAEPLSQYVNTPIRVTNIILKPTQRVDQATGELTPCVATYLVSDTTHAYFSMSQGVARCAAGILDSFGDPATWPDGGLEVVCKDVAINGGRRLKQLIVC